MKLKEMDPFIRKVVEIRLSCDRSREDVNELLISPDCRLFYIQDGEGTMILPKGAYALRSGCLITFPGGTPYEWRLKKEQQIHAVSVNFDYTRHFDTIRTSFHPHHADHFLPEDCLEHIRFEDDCVLNDPVVMYDVFFLKGIFDQLLTEYMIGGPYCGALLSTLAKSVLLTAQRGGHADERSSGLIRRIIRFIQLHYAEPLSYERLAAEFHFNPSYMNRLFRSSTGLSLHAFILRWRIREAEEWLVSTQITIQEIAHRTGFSDAAHFTRAFRALNGRTPSEVRESCSEREKIS